MRFNLKASIDLLTGLEAILTGSLPGEKLKCLYENLMSNNFRKTAVLKKKYMNLKLIKAPLFRILLKKFDGVNCASTTFKIFYTFVCNSFFLPTKISR